MIFLSVDFNNVYHADAIIFIFGNVKKLGKDQKI